MAPCSRGFQRKRIYLLASPSTPHNSIRNAKLLRTIPLNFAQFRTNPHDDAQFHAIPHSSAQFRAFQRNSAQFRTIPRNSDWKLSCMVF